MNYESTILFNLLIYISGFIFLLALNRTVFIRTSGWISLVINLLGLIVTTNLLTNTHGDISLEYEWLSLNEQAINFKVLINAQTKFMLILVQLIACFVNLFSTQYLQEDDGVNRFFAYLNLFVFAMLGLVLAGNIFQLYFFWELVGFCSYLLIGFWYTKKSANAAAIKAFLLNRVGDAFFLAGIFLVFYLYGTLDFETLTSASVINREYTLLSPLQLQTAAVLCLFGGVMAKSAQLPLQVWLPDAMEGPTPSSALIHAATMVVAGVFLLGRIQPIITEDARLFIAITGALTSLVAAIPALFHYDIKKVLAFSTISQLGFMVAAMGIGEVGTALFHLTSHAFFKAGLFLAAGAVISYMHHEQDMRKMGNLVKKMPLVFASYLIFSSALAGLPFTSGFLSKESILYGAYAYGLEKNDIKLAVPILLTITSFITSLYVIRQVVMVFFRRDYSPVSAIIDSTKKTVGGALKSLQDLLTADNDRGGEAKIINFIRSLGIFEVVVFGLALCSLWFVFSSNPFHTHEVWFFEHFNEPKILYDWLPWLMGFLVLAALLISYNSTLEEIRRYYVKEETSGFRKKFAEAARRQFYMDSLYENTFKRVFWGKRNASLLKAAETVEKKAFDFSINTLTKGVLLTSKIAGEIEKNIIDASVLGLFAQIKNIGNKIRKWNKGDIQLYLTGMVFVFILIVLLAVILV